MKTHIVLDTIYTPEEGQEVFTGTIEECNDYIVIRNTYGLEVRIMTKTELKQYNQ